MVSRALERCRREQSEAKAKLAKPDLTASEKFLTQLWLEDWFWEEVYLLRRDTELKAPQAPPWAEAAPRQMRLFETGATRNVDANKLDYEGFYAPQVLKRFAEYMHVNRKQADGALRSADNWQKGIPRDAYMKSLWRHFMDVWQSHRGLATAEDQEIALCAVMFNAQGYLYELLKARGYGEVADAKAKT